MKTLILAAIRCSLMFTAVTASLFSIRPAQANYIVTLQQVGPNVVATGSGAFDLTGLPVKARGFSQTLIQPFLGNIVTGSSNFCDDGGSTVSLLGCVLLGLAAFQALIQSAASMAAILILVWRRLLRLQVLPGFLTLVVEAHLDSHFHPATPLPS